MNPKDAQSAEITVVPLESVDKIELPGGSWSRMLITGDRAEGTESSIGFSIFTPGTATGSVSHHKEEIAYVVSGSGYLETDSGEVRFGAGDGLHIRPGVWHAVVNDSDADVVMVFGFSHPNYPPTDRR